MGTLGKSRCTLEKLENVEQPGRQDDIGRGNPLVSAGDSFVNVVCFFNYNFFIL